MRSSLSILAVLVASCGASTPPVDTASTVEPRGEPASSSELGPHAAATARCDGGPFALSVPTSSDSELGAVPHGCALVPRGMASADPNTLPWAVVFAFIPVGDSGAELELAVEPDGALRWASRVIQDATPTGEGAVTILGDATRWYGLHGGLPGGREGDAIVARVTMENTHVVALAMSAEARPELRDRYLATVTATTRPTPTTPTPSAAPRPEATTDAPTQATGSGAAQPQVTATDGPPGATVTAPDLSRAWTLRAMSVPHAAPAAPGPGPHRRWPVSGAEGVELRLHGVDPSSELAELWLAAGARLQFVLYMPPVGGAAESTDVGVTRVGDRLVVWGFNMNATALYASMLRASDRTPVGSPVYVQASPRGREHECRLTVCEARVMPVVDGDRLVTVLVYEGAALFDAPGRRGRAATFAGGVPRGDWSIGSLPPAWALRRDGARAILEPAR